MNLQRLDFASIRLVVLCAESGSLSEAPRRCHLSLSGASHRLKAFEDAVVVPAWLAEFDCVTMPSWERGEKPIEALEIERPSRRQLIQHGPER